MSEIIKTLKDFQLRENSKVDKMLKSLATANDKLKIGDKIYTVREFAVVSGQSISVNEHNDAIKAIEDERDTAIKQIHILEEENKNLLELLQENPSDEQVIKEIKASVLEARLSLQALCNAFNESLLKSVEDIKEKADKANSDNNIALKKIKEWQNE